MPERTDREYHLSRGEWNRPIDDLCHPFFKTRAELILLDSLLHALVDQDPPLAVRKFLTCNLPRLMKELDNSLRNG